MICWLSVCTLFLHSRSFHQIAPEPSSHHHIPQSLGYPLRSVERRIKKLSLINFPPFLIRIFMFTTNSWKKGQNLCDWCQTNPRRMLLLLCRWCWSERQEISFRAALMTRFTAGDRTREICGLEPPRSIVSSSSQRETFARIYCGYIVVGGAIKMRLKIPWFPIKLGDTSAASWGRVLRELFGIIRLIGSLLMHHW